MLHSGLGPVDLNEEDGRKPALPQVPTSQSPPSINLDVLLDFAIQQTFHELTVLSELLPKKKETDRKISVVQFAHSTRVIFVKLLAIVKWVKISKRFEPLSNICHFLDEQAKIFVNTADSLVELARTKLVIARLPVFQITQAVDVLTLGTYPRLPTCIKEYFIPETPLSHKEQAQTLSRLNKVIEYRLCQSANVLSPRIRDIKIRNGKVSLTVPGEFEAELTLLSPRANAKWCLLNVKILVEDYDIGYGTKLVHPLQVNFIHQLLQAKMDVSSQPLHDAYLLLHSFCQSLQLDLLYCQVVQMASTISPNMLQVEKYDPKEALLIVSYWLTKTNKKLSSQFRITISGDKNSPHTSLKVRHYPPSPNLPILDDDTGHLSINRLISETILIRCRERLLRLRKMLEMVRPLSRAQLSGNTVPTLKYMLFTRDHQSEDEALIISLNMFFGTFVCHVSSLGESNAVCCC
jgi:mediator of RNA polymerase II transcription subunit 14